MKNIELSKEANRFGAGLKSCVKHLATGISLAVVLFFSAGAYAQTESRPFAIGVDAGMGLFGFPGVDGGISDYYTGDILISGYYDLHPNWSLTVGFGYQYQFQYYTPADDFCKSASSAEKRLEDRHYFRTQFGAEFHKKWFYVKAGAFFERGTEPWVAANVYEVFLFGGFAQPGVRFSLTDKSSLRFGVQMNYGKRFEKRILGLGGSGWRKEYLSSSINAGWKFIYNMICVGYEYHF